jgi:hypothetical protein
MSENGKGSRRRKSQVDQKTWDKNYERIFGRTTKNSSLAIDNADTKDIMKIQRGRNQSRD